MKTQNQGTIVERSLLWMFKAYLASYLVLEGSKTRNNKRKMQRIVRN
ncbi:MAG TPA: hypothetical protein VJH92_01585 [Candidatus Nanoarchaeia archaeon]|nr:hypothetical protein [Candidatus Nanoarchaeia archaeon]